MKNPKECEKQMMVSVIIPYQNEKIYIGDCLDSLEEQTCQDFEVIVVCDHSSGEAMSALFEKTVSFPLQIVELTDRQGVAAARNQGILAAKGEFILFLDSDDYLEKTAIACLLERSVGRDVVYGRNRRTWYGRTIFYDNGEMLDETNAANQSGEDECEEDERGDDIEKMMPEEREEDCEWKMAFSSRRTILILQTSHIFSGLCARRRTFVRFVRCCI